MGKEEAAKIDQDLEDEDDGSDIQINPYGGIADGNTSEADASNPANKVTEMFQRLLNMNEKESGQMIVQVAGDGAYISFDLLLVRQENHRVLVDCCLPSLRGRPM